MSSPAHQVSESLGILLQRRLRRNLQADVIAGVHDEIDISTYPVISAIARMGPVSVTALGIEIGIDRSLASRKAAQLIEAGLLRSAPDPSDRRASLLELTDDGQRVIDTLRENLATIIDAHLQHWTSADRRNLARLLDRFVTEITDAAS